jgi:hypothetical protein
MKSDVISLCLGAKLWSYTEVQRLNAAHSRPLRCVEVHDHLHNAAAFYPYWIRNKMGTRTGPDTAVKKTPDVSVEIRKLPVYSKKLHWAINLPFLPKTAIKMFTQTVQLYSYWMFSFPDYVGGQTGLIYVMFLIHRAIGLYRMCWQHLHIFFLIKCILLASYLYIQGESRWKIIISWCYYWGCYQLKHRTNTGPIFAFVELWVFDVNK